MALSFAPGSCCLTCTAHLGLAPRVTHFNVGRGSRDSRPGGGIRRPNVPMRTAASAPAQCPTMTPYPFTSASGTPTRPLTSVKAGAPISAPSDDAEDVDVPLAALSTLFGEMSAAELGVLLEEVASSTVQPKINRRRQQQHRLLGFVSMDDSRVIRQRFTIPSYEVGADQNACIETIMKYLQDICVNHASMAGVLAEGNGRTFEMTKRGLIWAVTKMQIEVERFPRWGDLVEVESWLTRSGKNAKRRDWLIRDCSTGEIITRASSVWVMMNMETRRLSKMPYEVLEEIQPCLVEGRPCVLDADISSVPKLDSYQADHTCQGLSPTSGDIDANQHVNNVKYINWILRSVPVSLMDTHQLTSLMLKYRKECKVTSVLSSLTKIVAQGALESGSSDSMVECHHLLQFDDCKSEILRARTLWKPKQHI